YVLLEVIPGLPFRLDSSKNKGCHVVAGENRRLAFDILFRKFDTRYGGESGHEVQAANSVIILGTGLYLARHPSHSRNSVTAFSISSLRAAKRRVARVGIDILPSAIVRCPKDQGVTLVQAKCADLIEH